MEPSPTPKVAKMRLAEAAEMLGVHPETLRRWADEGKVPYVRILGGERRFASEDIEAVMVVEETA